MNDLPATNETEASATQSPTVIETYLAEFVKNNPHVEISVDTETIRVAKPWGADDVTISCPLKDHPFLETLNCLSFNPRFDAIIHTDTNTIEVFASYFSKNERFNPIIDRKFKFHFDGIQCKCSFAEPSERCWQIAERFENTPAMYSRSTASQLDMFKDARNYENLTEATRKFFDTRVPRNFFLSPDKPVGEICLSDLMRHLNFTMDYYDRDSPMVIIRPETDGEQEDLQKHIRFVEDEFPAELVITQKDEIVLQLLETARIAPSRHAFVYY